MTCNCTSAVDLGCNNPFRDTAFHRLNNCFFPMLQAFHYAAIHNGCIHAEKPVSAPFANLFLHSTLPRSRAKIYSHTLQWDYRKGAFPAPQIHFCGSHVVPRAATNHPRITASILSIYMHVFMGEHEDWHSVLVLRQRTRRFTDEDAILRNLNVNGRRWHVYRGFEPLAQTLRIFGGAKEVVGYHGAGLLNVVFSRFDTPRVHEISTFRDLKGRRQWRAYVGAIARKWNPRVHQTIQRIPLAHILAANKLPLGNLSDREIKNLHWVHLSEDDISDILCHLDNHITFDLASCRYWGGRSAQTLPA